MFRKIFFILLIAVLVILGFSGNFPFNCKTKTDIDTLKVKSSSFHHNDYIPAKYTCDAENIMPSIEWSKGPAQTQSYTVICDDPDAPSKVWVHWVLFNIPPSVTKIEGNISENITEGLNDFGDTGYSGPCPPSGIHHYHFKVYALDSMLSLRKGALRDDVDAAMKDHILAKGEIIGLYERKK
ncbi:MAG TPA: YbhB/YbcL family Raf kinase inhibitor-like protein [Bacteroidales bacterium]|nr:YbhB/YbcL family Raf kinase inhibitor-like protein [Bacteroidales bacterium]HPS15728.1 YbhB/YbcL family Raf kinase inhibitor-like protein [Bacteroidales bacterium]